MGISYAVVTKVKELTEEKRYGEALDLLEGADIYQSLNPQFLRCCGEVYLESDRLRESREVLVRAHIMAPEGNRILYDLVHLYLKMGYFQRAGVYYDLYMHTAPSDDVGRLYLQYMMKKARRAEAGELVSILERACEERYTDDWGFELALLYASLGNREKMKEECIHLTAAFRNSPYCALADALKKGEYDITNSYFRFPIMEAADDDEQDAEIRNLEDRQLEQDELRVNPPDPVILQMEDDDGAEEPAKEKKRRFPFGKRHSKERKPEQDAEAAAEPTAALTERQEESEAVAPDTLTEMDSEVSEYIASVMQSVEDIEQSVTEELQHPISFQTARLAQEETEYQPKLLDVEESLSPKERLERLMQMIEEEKQEALEREPKQSQYIEEELDMDEFLRGLAGANSITEAMAKSYHQEQDS